MKIPTFLLLVLGSAVCLAAGVPRCPTNQFLLQIDPPGLSQPDFQKTLTLANTGELAVRSVVSQTADSLLLVIGPRAPQVFPQADNAAFLKFSDQLGLLARQPGVRLECDQALNPLTF